MSLSQKGYGTQVYLVNFEVMLIAVLNSSKYAGLLSLFFRFFPVGPPLLLLFSSPFVPLPSLSVERPYAKMQNDQTWIGKTHFCQNASASAQHWFVRMRGEFQTYSLTWIALHELPNSVCLESSILLAGILEDSLLGWYYESRNALRYRKKCW